MIKLPYTPPNPQVELEKERREVARLLCLLNLATTLNNALQTRLDQKEARILELTKEVESLTDKLAEITVEAEKLQRQLDLLNEVPY
jgi:seryl-tRNA synthetase